MADGTAKPIAEIVVGDRVEAATPDTPAVADRAEAVTHLHVNHDYALADLTVTDAAGHQDVLHTTGDHPIWDASPTSGRLRRPSAPATSSRPQGLCKIWI